MSENFTELATSIQRGTHPSPPINPILPVLEDLESEVQDIVTGFETRLRRLKRDGERNLGQVDVAADESVSASEPTVSILPVPEDEIRRHGAKDDIPPVIVGRTKEEVVEALGRAEEEGAGSLHSQTVRKESESVVEILAKEVSAEGGQASPSSAGVHVEL